MSRRRKSKPLLASLSSSISLPPTVSPMIWGPEEASPLRGSPAWDCPVTSRWSAQENSLSVHKRGVSSSFQLHPSSLGQLSFSSPMWRQHLVVRHEKTPWQAAEAKSTWELCPRLVFPLFLVIIAGSGTRVCGRCKEWASQRALFPDHSSQPNLEKEFILGV